MPNFTAPNFGLRNDEQLVSMLKQIFFLLLCLLMLVPTGTVSAQKQPQLTTERIAFSAYRNGQWDIYSVSPDGSEPRQLTNDIYEDTDPSYSPDGSKIAFASRRNRQWDIYIIDLLTGEEIRLTDSFHYQGKPAWSPNGQQLAYESYDNGNLDIWLIDVAGDRPAVNLTESSSAGDFAPAWSPDGQFIAFVSWREGNKELFLLDTNTNEEIRLTNTTTAEEQPTWHPDGKRLSFVIDNLGDREIFTLEITNPPTQGGTVQPVTWLGRADGVVWNPSGENIAVVFHRWDGEILTVIDPEAVHKLPQQLSGVINMQGQLTWHSNTVLFGQPVATLADLFLASPYKENISLNELSAPDRYNMVRLNDLDTGMPWLADTVDDSFKSWRFRLQDEVGYDFLGRLSDAARDVGAYTENSQYASWHKTGRAIDTLFDYNLITGAAHEIHKENYSGETYWRTYLRCVDQDGSCGRPLTVNSWNYSPHARTQLAPEQGGIEKANISGYYVDMTAMAREYGWERISSYNDNDYSWTWHFLAFEYWHYQKRAFSGNDGTKRVAKWYEAMLDVYPPQKLGGLFTWDKMKAKGEDPYLIALKGIPLPLEIKPWWLLVTTK